MVDHAGSNYVPEDILAEEDVEARKIGRAADQVPPATSLPEDVLAEEYFTARAEQEALLRGTDAQIVESDDY